MINFLPFWSINGALDLDRLCVQLAQFQENGFNGVVFQPRRYPRRPDYLGPEYMKIVSDLILEAKRLGMRFWLYDENGWPSGTADGEILRRHPDWATLRLDLSYEEHADAVLSFTAPDGRSAWLYPQTVAGVDPFHPEGCRLFIELVHERYRKELAPEAFEYVEAFFADEPESGASWEPMPKHGGVPWSEHLASALGAGALEKLPLLFFDAPGAAEFRVHYYQTMTDVLERNFFRPYRAWCDKYGKYFTAHIKGEEHPCFQLPLVGSNTRIQRSLSMPGLDALERFPGNHFFPTQVASAARQFGDGRCMAEAFGGSGWGILPRDLERYVLWLARCGVTDFVMHLAHYEMDTAAIRDWPPSQPLDLPWRGAYGEVLKRIKETLAVETHPRRRLLVVPYREFMTRYRLPEFLRMNIHDGDDFAMTEAGRLNAALLVWVEAEYARHPDFDITDDRTWEEEGQMLSGGRCRLGKMEYAELLFFTPPIEPLWALCEAPDNSLLLEPADDSTQTRHHAHWKMADPALPCRLVFADAASDVRVNGVLCSGGLIPPGTLKEENTLEFRTSAPIFRPFVYVRGAFSVRNTEGTFVLGAVDFSPSGDLAAAGWPFLDAPLRARAAFHLPPGTRHVTLLGIGGSAARLACGGVCTAWCWGPEWDVELPEGFPLSGELEIELAPSGFNHFGPHHYIYGDAKVISPGQMVGERNFAEPADAPEKIHDGAWRFIPFMLPWGLLPAPRA